MHANYKIIININKTLNYIDTYTMLNMGLIRVSTYFLVLYFNYYSINLKLSIHLIDNVSLKIY